MKARVVTIITLAALLGGASTVLAAQVKETFQGNSGKKVFILEDIHGDIAVQQEHLKTLSDLIQNEKLRLVATEGSVGYLSSFPLQMASHVSSSRLAAGEALLQRNQINAAHLVRAVGGANLTVVGVENRNAYEGHLAIAEKISARAGRVSEEFGKLASTLPAEEIQNWEKIFSLRVNRQTAAQWKAGSLVAQIEAALAKAENAGIDGKVLREQAQAVEAFYSAALSRDAILAENTLTRMELEQKNVCALIVGGFHTGGITQILRENGVSYTVISPE